MATSRLMRQLTADLLSHIEKIPLTLREHKCWPAQQPAAAVRAPAPPGLAAAQKRKPTIRTPQSENARSSKQTGLVPAVATVLPHSRHQFYQAHYLRYLASPKIRRN
jgi:hypothetical protein